MPFDVLLVDDHKIMRDGIKAILTRAGDFRVVGEAENGTDAVQFVKKFRPQLVLMDIGLPGLDGWQASRILKSDPETHAIPLIAFSARVDSTADLAGRRPEPDPDPALAPNDARFAPPPTGAPEAGASLFPPNDVDGLRTQWMNIQSKFVDEPRHAVEEADGLVAATVQRLAEGFASARARLEGEWARGRDVSTEDLRVALTRYRSFFDRLLTV